MTWTGTENFREGLVAQRTFLATRVPSYARVLEIVEAELERVVDRVQPAWGERRFDAWYERPLLLLGALRYQALEEGSSHPLFAAIAAEPPSPESVTRDAVMAALAPERSGLDTLLAERAVQTNETSRAVAWMWVAALAEQVDPGRGLALADLGCSAGLNLVADGLGSPWVDAADRPITTGPLPRIETRLGMDLRPLDATSPDTARWLRACVWPGQVERQERLDASLAALGDAHRAGRAPVLEAMSIAEAPTRLERIDGELRVLAVQTIMRDYVPEPVKREYFARMREWITRAPAGRALWVELENTDDIHEPDRITALTVHLRTSGDAVQSIELARTHPHPSRLFVDDAAVAALVEALGRARG